MIYDFRAPDGSPERENARRCVGGRCYVDGVEVPRVCYADTEAGIVHWLPVREWTGPGGHIARGPYIMGRHDLPPQVDIRDIVDPTYDEILRVVKRGRVVVIEGPAPDAYQGFDAAFIPMPQARPIAPLASRARVYELD